ncbi:hypothetical protein MMC11_004249 [Xylographa trunciseda]|nr:hypothetical protein [Xylographa trunciseda]
MSSGFMTWFTTVDSILPFFGAHVLLAIGLGYTQPSSTVRPLLLLLIIAFCLISVRSTVSRSIPGEIGGEYVIGFIFHASHFLCLAKLSPPPKSTERGRWTWSTNQLFEARWGISTKILPSWPKRSKDAIPSIATDKDILALTSIDKDTKTARSSTGPDSTRGLIPSRQAFLLRRTWDLAWTISIIWLLKSNRLLIYPDDITSVPHGFLHRLADITPREAFIRVYFTFLGWVIPYCTLRAGHSLAGCICVLCGDLPERWPPLFGSIGDAYTIRRFYALFWHHLMRKAFTSHAVFIVNKVLHLPRNNPVSRYLIIILTFLISAGLHLAAGMALSECVVYAQTRYFFSIAAVIILEDAVIWLYKSKFSSSALPADDPRRTLWRLVGYSWVAFFHVWSSSKTTFSSFCCAHPDL